MAEFSESPEVIVHFELKQLTPMDFLSLMDFISSYQFTKEYVHEADGEKILDFINGNQHIKVTARWLDSKVEARLEEAHMVHSFRNLFSTK